MTLASYDDWSATAADNTDIGGISIAEGMKPSAVNNAIRELMAQLRAANLAPLDIVPIGAGIDWFSSTLPSKWLWRDGSAVSRTTYAALFDEIEALPEGIVSLLGRHGDLCTWRECAGGNFCATGFGEYS